MKSQIYKIDDWTVQIFYSVNSEDIKEIENALERIDCPPKLIQRAEQQIMNDDLDTGFTYSNFALEESVISIGEVSSMYELVDTLTHELYHLIDHIRIVRNYDYEESATMYGDFIRLIFRNIVDIFNEI